MKIIVLLLSLMTTGCLYQEAGIKEIKKAEKACVGNGGLVKIRVHFQGTEQAFCAEGQVVLDLDSYPLPNG